MGNGLVRLNNGGDDIVLYQGGATDGIPCDYVEYYDPAAADHGISGLPVGFSWDNTVCNDPISSQPFGTSISLDPDGNNGVSSDSACDWTESGLNSPNDPGIPNTGGPDTQGYNNTTTPTAVSLASFGTSANHSGTAAAGYLFVMMGLFTGWIWQKKRAN